MTKVRSLKKYSAAIFTSQLKKVQFPNDNTFLNVDVVYSVLLNKIWDTIDHAAPIEEIRIKDNMQEWFDIEIPEAIKLERNISKSPKTQIFK